MILIDRRQGSGHLARAWPNAQLDDLRFADVAILGRGPGGRGVTCGIELKKLDELMGDLHTGRFFGHQAPGLRRTYDVAWLVVEGRCKQGRNDELLVPRFHKLKGRGWTPLQIGTRGIAYSTAMFTLLTIAQKAGIHVWPTETTGQTLTFCQKLADWWLRGWDLHQSMDTFYTAPATGEIDGAAWWAEHTLVRRMAKEIKGIGWKRSRDVADRFDSVQQMANAETYGWEQVKGISKRRAREIVRELRNDPDYIEF